MVDEHAHVIRVARYRTDPGRRGQLLAGLQALAGAMCELPGLFGAQVCTINEAPEWLALIARWRDEAAMRGIAETSAAQLAQDVVGLADEEVIEHFITT
jgi:quinol monooxygenase YgiN